jgi:predicted transcriptional regulator
MTNEDIIQDLKQFIAATVSQSEERINANLKGVKTELESRISDLDAKVDTIHDAVADAISQSNESTDAAIQDHEQRLRRLEQRPA